ncbi:MAG: 23S rRNA (adenine(2503)-C(2))-methyltransferase RlmN [Actinomycetota bacterium]
MNSKDLFALSKAEWRAFADEIGQPGYRGEQIHRWMHVDLAGSFDEMTNLSKTLRAELTGRFTATFDPPTIVQAGDRGTTRKALFTFDGKALAETVLMAYSDRATVCVSSQAGCGMGCPFCATGQMGLLRNLTAGEIVAQVLWAARTLRDIDIPSDWCRRISNVVFMGMGEPLANFERVYESIERLHDADGYNLSARGITVSTVGVLPGIDRLAASPIPVTLALSLHAPDDELRSRLVPLNQRYAITDLLKSCRRFRHAHGRRVSIEYAMIGGVNDSVQQARALAKLLTGEDFHVNLIPLNPTRGFDSPGSSQEQIEIFRQTLLSGGINATVRHNRGTDIDAACGQLGARTLDVSEFPSAR